MTKKCVNLFLNNQRVLYKFVLKSNFLRIVLLLLLYLSRVLLSRLQVHNLLNVSLYLLIIKSVLLLIFFSVRRDILLIPISVATINIDPNH